MFALATLLLRYARLRSVCFAVWASVNPAFPHAHDAPAIADAIATAVLQDRDPVFGSQEEEAAVAARFALGESSLRIHPIPYRDPKTGKAVDPLAAGVFQLHGPAGHADVVMQARAWLVLLHAGRESCPESPAGPLSGSCSGAGKRLADRRVAGALAVVRGDP
jgi:hypothetical protein